MFNVFVQDKRRLLRKQALSQEKLLRSADKTREVLTFRYKERINGALIKLVKDSQGIPKPARQETSANAFATAKHAVYSSQSRIKAVESQHKWLDLTPTQRSAFNLRPRDKQREIQSSLSLNHKLEINRIQETILKHKALFDSSDPPNSCRTGLYKDYSGNPKRKFSGGKEVADYYHFKTHFKTIESLALDLHSSTRYITKAEAKERSLYEKLGMNDGRAGIYKRELCKEEVLPVSAEILEKYGMWKPRQGRDKGASPVTTKRLV